MARFRPADFWKIGARSYYRNDGQQSGPRHISFGVDDPRVVSVDENGFGQKSSNVFKFDKIFTPQSSQDEVYDFVGADIVNDAFNGYNSSVLAYGQTGSGKTHTMFGKSESNLKSGAQDKSDVNDLGIIPRVAKEIFENMKINSKSLENVKVQITL